MDVGSISVVKVIVIKRTLTVGPPVEILHVENPEGHIRSRCKSPSRRRVWYKPYCCPVEHKIELVKLDWVHKDGNLRV